MVGFHDLYERHRAGVYRFALFLSGNPAQAEDLASDTFVRAWTARGSIREATVRAYLLTITRNLWRDLERRNRRHVPLDAFMFRDGRVTWFLMRDRPSVAAAFAVTALACWVAAWIINRRAR
jgi:DNA-directed RNA polymerase specialized sigma24 family protein